MKVKFTKSNWELNNIYLEEYLNSLTCSMDSYMEDNLIKSEVFSVNLEDKHVGFAAKQEETLYYFYIEKPKIRFAQSIFEQFIKEQHVSSVFFQTSDTLLVSLVCDWEFEKKKGAYFFLDAGRIEKPLGISGTPIFRIARQEDIEIIKQHTGDFFDNLQRRIDEVTIYMLFDQNVLLGCGIIEYGRLFKQHASIGMITCKEHRHKGIGQIILWYLKEVCYEKGITPIAGCWYYNTLSRKTLEKANMISVARGMRANLISKENIPERTGNPPGEEV
jgi:hypothetical protein